MSCRRTSGGELVFRGSSSIRRSLAVLVAVPIVVILALVGTIVGIQFGHADQAAGVGRSMTVATQVGGVLAALEADELSSVGFVVGTQTAADLDKQSSAVADRIADVETNVRGLPARVRAAIDDQSALSSIRNAVRAQTASTSATIAAFTSAIDSIIDSLSLASIADTSTAAGRQVLALDALLRIDADHAASAAALLAAAAQRTESSIAAYVTARGASDGLEDEFTANASPTQRSLHGLAANAYAERVGAAFAAEFAASPSATLTRLSPSALYPQLVSYVQLGRLAEAKIAADVTSAVNRAASASRTTGYVMLAVAIVVAVLVLIGAWLVIRSVAGTLGGLARAAARAAEHTAAQLRRVVADETETADHVPMGALPVADRTEVGELARVFVGAQRTVTTVVERQAAARRNLRHMSGNAGRRGANLVARQLALIDRLQRAETDPRTLDELYRLDHVTSRLHRVTASLVTLSETLESGRHEAEESRYMTPMSLADVIALAAGEIEGDSRVDVFIPANTMLEPAVIDDIVLLFAELLANSTAYSPPATRVRVMARPYDRDVSIIDEGIGMSNEQIATVNARLAEPERLDLASTGALGLFLVGRLARRHDLRVTFEHTPGGGVTVVVDLGQHVRTVTPQDTARATATVLASASIPRPRDADSDVVGVGNGRGTASRLPELDSQPFNIERYERATEVLGAGAPWNAFEVLPPRQPELPSGSTAPELPGKPQAGNGGVEEQDVPHAGTGFATSATRLVSSTFPAGGVARYVPTDDATESGPDDEGADAGGSVPLSRRVPGASVPNNGAEPLPNFRTLDPDEARSLVEQFEIGVARALGETAADRADDEGR